MGIAVIIALCGLIAQAPAEEPGLGPYTVRLKDGRTLHVLARESEIGGVSIKAMIDEPWYMGDPWLRIQRNEIQEGGIELELPALRADRLRRGWLENGGVSVSTRSDGETWVLKTEKEWADKAQALARAAYTPDESAVPGSDTLPEVKSHAGPGLVPLWAPHAAIVAGAIALAAGVFFALLRPRERWQPLDSGSPRPRRR